MKQTETKDCSQRRVLFCFFSPTVLWRNGSESSMWSSSSSGLVTSTCPNRQPSDPPQRPFPPRVLDEPRAASPPRASQPASSDTSSRPAGRRAGRRALPSHHRCAVLLLHLEGECEEEGGDNEKKKRIFCRPKVSYWVPVGRAMGQRAVRPKLHRQYIMPLESNQLSEMGS